MTDKADLERRQMLRLLAATGVAAGAVALNSTARAASCEHDGTPLQFVPKTAPDPNPQDGDLVKYPKCPYCGMDRQHYHHSRHLVHYQDDLADATCSLHCAALSLALNLDRGPKAIYAADFGAAATPKPLVNAEAATYLIGSKLPGVMTAQSKVAFAAKAAAEAASVKEGGELGDFDVALKAAYQSMAGDTLMIRKKRAEKKQPAGPAKGAAN
ncbi:MAG: nitrous oxide reductase accessory protein NosL [Candidatus Competibacteraceae bacterium]|nr:nitrous oxide reductase accessory protein NosL [Candidatus Competibacteraceae bacterium]